MSIPPPKNISLLSNSIVLNLLPTTGCNLHPDPLPPDNEILSTASISKFWGSTRISFTVPFITGSTKAGFPVKFSTSIMGGFNTS